MMPTVRDVLGLIEALVVEMDKDERLAAQKALYNLFDEHEMDIARDWIAGRLFGVRVVVEFEDRGIVGIFKTESEAKACADAHARNLLNAANIPFIEETNLPGWLYPLLPVLQGTAIVVKKLDTTLNLIAIDEH